MSRSILHLIAIVILVAGLGSVALIERNAGIYDATSLEDSEATHALLYPQDYGSYARSSEMMGGKLGLLLDGWLRSAKDLGHSRPFAITIAVISLITAAGIFTISIRSASKLDQIGGDRDGVQPRDESTRPS